MKIIWNKVTWYSKLLAVVVFAFAIWLGVYFWDEYKEIQNIKASPHVIFASQLVNTSDWKTYKNEKYGFEFKYPQTWQVTEGRRMSSQATTTIVSSGDGKISISIGDYASCDSQMSSSVLCDVKNYMTFITDSNDPEALSILQAIMQSYNTDYVSLDTSDWETYRNEKYGFEFKYQKGLFLEGSIEDHGVMFLANYDVSHGEGRSYDPKKDKGKFKIDISYASQKIISSSTPIFFVGNGFIARLFLDTDAGAYTFQSLISSLKFTK